MGLKGKSLKQFFRLIVGVLVLSIISTNAASAEESKACKVSAKPAKSIGQLVVAGQISQLPSVQWGIDNNCYSKYGLDIKTEIVGTTQIGMAGIVGGSYDLVINTPTNLYLANSNEGFSGVIVAPRHGYTPSELIRAKLEPFFPGELLLQTALIAKRDSNQPTDGGRFKKR